MSTCPQLKDVDEHVTPLCAPDWKEMGTKLNIPYGELRIIEADNPRSVKECFIKMLNKWLDIDCTASWEKLLTAIKSLAVACSNQSMTVRCE